MTPSTACLLSRSRGVASRVHSSSQLHHINLTAITITSIITITSPPSCRISSSAGAAVWAGARAAHLGDRHLALGGAAARAISRAAAARGRELPLRLPRDARVHVRGRGGQRAVGQSGGRAHPSAIIGRPSVHRPPMHPVAVWAVAVARQQPGPSRAPQDGGEVLLRPQVVLREALAVDGGVVLVGHPEVEPQEGHQDEEEEDVEADGADEHDRVQRAGQPPPLVGESTREVEEVGRLRGDGEERVGDGDAGVEEEEQEELAVVEAHRVHHPRAEVIHVQRQPSGDRAEVRARGLVQARPAAHLQVLLTGRRERGHPPLPPLGRHARVGEARVRPREHHEREQHVEDEDGHHAAGAPVVQLQGPEHVRDVVESDDRHHEERGRSGAGAIAAARCAAANVGFALLELSGRCHGEAGCACLGGTRRG
eukprot:CAMPEP_0118831758 /NCGR_PEP_ID=MMETSP1162-20130426/32130_1 /TAXON_ID=33656 /ORGANISM="Phaeocystis Sp, Strain CCMP2710" /LENGTH=424 /DNA_ID=CAMNT_0006763223 /DNA_START=49 /DNA_END=1320 /DNA_ORIENTATION=-